MWMTFAIVLIYGDHELKICSTTILVVVLNFQFAVYYSVKYNDMSYEKICNEFFIPTICLVIQMAT